VSKLRVAVLGASSFVGVHVLELLNASGAMIIALTRQTPPSGRSEATWEILSDISVETRTKQKDSPEMPFWICVAPIWILPDYFERIKASRAKRIVVVSSTSRFTKIDSGDATENAVAAMLINGEAQVQAWAQEHDIEWVILRPTLIYGDGRDKNISEIARVIRRFGFFPLLGRAQGLRQPIHAKDVAKACVSALTAPIAKNKSYNLSGRETLTYRKMVERVFESLSRPVRFVTVPILAFRMAVTVLKFFPRFKHWTTAMAERMNRDLVFDHSDAARDLNFQPEDFALSQKDLPRNLF
jgi:nucleoside-diphosphate-sugar epimerase